MNFLAHAFLARRSVPHLVGNFIADFVKGKQVHNYENGILDGIIMHRKIDEYTDNHEMFRLSRSRIRKKYNHYSGVVIDLFYDHFLAKNWEEYEKIPLDKFAKFVYSVILDHEYIIPDKAQNMLPYMIKYNWLVNYRSIEGIDRSLKGLANRTPYPSRMDEAAGDLVKYYDYLESDFRKFFPDIISYFEN
jgi:acyl carrier protein phosphodiesterase